MKIPFPLLPKSVRWLGVIGISGFIFYTSILTVPPDVQPPGAEEGIFSILAEITEFAVDKWRHFAAYGLLAYSLAYASINWKLTRFKHALYIILISIGYGLGIEVIQFFTPHRYLSILDIIANSIGPILVLPWFLLYPYLKFRELW